MATWCSTLSGNRIPKHGSTDSALTLHPLCLIIKAPHFSGRTRSTPEPCPQVDAQIHGPCSSIRHCKHIFSGLKHLPQVALGSRHISLTSSLNTRWCQSPQPLNNVWVVWIHSLYPQPWFLENKVKGLAHVQPAVLRLCGKTVEF